MQKPFQFCIPALKIPPPVMPQYLCTFQKSCFRLINYWFSILIESDDCHTNGGADPSAQCIFPFTFGGIEYFECTYNGNYENETKPWCSTKVDYMGNHIGNQGNWGYCGEDCPLPGKY